MRTKASILSTTSAPGPETSVTTVAKVPLDAETLISAENEVDEDDSGEGLTIAEAKRRLGITFGVDPSSIKIISRADGHASMCEAPAPSISADFQAAPASNWFTRPHLANYGLELVTQVLCGPSRLSYEGTRRSQRESSFLVRLTTE
jgi:hypothetical protein